MGIRLVIGTVTLYAGCLYPALCRCVQVGSVISTVLLCRLSLYSALCRCVQVGSVISTVLLFGNKMMISSFFVSCILSFLASNTDLYYRCFDTLLQQQWNKLYC